jgi:hypothetical protein
VTTIVSNQPITSSEREDIREQLFNEGLTGPITHVQVSTERIAKLRGILFDIDPDIGCQFDSVRDKGLLNVFVLRVLL